MLVIPVLLINDAQIKPGVGDGRVLLLRLDQFRYAVFGLARTEKCQPVVHPLSSGIGRYIERFLELADGFLLRRGVLVERLPQIAMVPEKILLLPRSIGPVK